MKFYNRTKELHRLAELTGKSQGNAHLLVISGRRRIGKTELIRHFSAGQKDFLYFFVSKKKSHVLLDEFTEILAERIPVLKSVKVKSFEALFSFIFHEMSKRPVYVVFDEFQNFLQVDDSVFSTLQKLWDENKHLLFGAIICIGSIQTLMRDIFEGNKEPLFGRATAKMHLKPLTADVVAEILGDNGLEPSKHLLPYTSMFGGVPKYYFLLDRHNLFKKSMEERLVRLFCEPDAILQNEGRELLIEEFGKNYHLYFSILQVIASGETQMARIADSAGISVNSISKYLDELVSYYQVVERRLPVTSSREDMKSGRYHVSDPLLKFWFRYIHRNQSLIGLGESHRLAEKIQKDLPTYMGWTFEVLIRDLLTNRNNGSLVPFGFDKIGGYWNRNGTVEIDIVALDSDSNQIFFGECKLNGNKFTAADAKRFKDKAAHVKWGGKGRREYFALISHDELRPQTIRLLEEEGIICMDLKRILSSVGSDSGRE
mgnify:CR=1 FL=1